MQINDSSVAIVTGGASGLGEATTRRLVADGATVVVLDLASSTGADLAAELGAAVTFVPSDVRDEEQVQAAIDIATAQGELRIAVTCAGIGTPGRVVGRNGPHPLDVFRRVVEVNLIGTFNVLRLAAAAMTLQAPNANGERGVIINTSSVASFEGQIGQAGYAASKAGVNGMTLPIARELAKFGIRVMTIAPGIFDTPMLQGMSEEIRASLGAQIPFPSRLGRPDEYAALAKHIIENEVLNGEVIRLDGAIRMGAK